MSTAAAQRPPATQTTQSSQKVRTATLNPSSAGAQGVGPAKENLRVHLTRACARVLCLILVDVGVIWFARIVLRLTRDGALGAALATLAQDLLPLGAVSGAQLAVATVLAHLFLGGYRADDRWRDPVRVLSAAGVGVLLALYSDAWHGDPATVIGRGLLTWTLLGPLMVAARLAVHRVSERWVRSKLQHKVLEIRGEGAKRSSVDLGPGYFHVATMLNDRLSSDIESMETLLAGGVDTILVHGQVPSDRFADLTDFALTHGCRLLCLPRTERLLGIDSKRVWMQGHPMSELTTPGMRASHLVLKRALDVAVSAFLIVALSPLLLLVALWVRLDSPGPILFIQKRPGFQGKSFPMAKFRSMRSDAEAALKADPELYEAFLQNDCKLPQDIDPRLTRSGRFLRKTSLDELPQLFNVLRGEMSLVGPRPLVGPELENYRGRVRTLLSVKPGITGSWQVSGRSRVTYPERAEIDLEYVRNWSFLGDLWILAVTPLTVLMGRGAH